MVKKIALAVAIMSLSAAPAWALPGKGHAEGSHKGSTRSMEVREDHGKGKAGTDHGKSGEKHGKAMGEHGKSHKCKPHAVAYTAAGVLVSDTLTEGEHQTVSGEVTVEVKRGNHFAKADKGTTKTYMLEDSRLRGPLKVSALAKGDFVKLIGRITVLAPKCKTSEFTPTLKIRQIVFHAPSAS